MKKTVAPKGFYGTDVCYCISKNCENKCGRKFTQEIEDYIQSFYPYNRISIADMCGEVDEQ